MRATVRWDSDLREFQYQCTGCAKRGRRSFWLLTFEFWNPARGMARRLACQREADAAAKRDHYRASEAYRADRIARCRAYQVAGDPATRQTAERVRYRAFVSLHRRLGIPYSLFLREIAP